MIEQPLEAAMQGAGEPAGLVRPRLSHGDEFFSWMRDDRIITFGWVTMHDRFVGPVRPAEAPGRMFLYNFHTLERFRGRGLYPALLLRMRYELGLDGARALIVDVDVENSPSWRGIEKAGFTRIGSVLALVLLNRWQLPLQGSPLAQTNLDSSD
jgi:GNAT superfamily N-acetyltransferase